MGGGRLPAVNGKRVIQALMRAGFVVNRTVGSHHVLVYPGDPTRTVSGTAFVLKPFGGDDAKLWRAELGSRRTALWYDRAMTTKTLKEVMAQAATWPREDQDELAEYAREIEARRTGTYTMSDDERIAVGRGLAEADRGEFVPDELVAEADRRHGQ